MKRRRHVLLMVTFICIGTFFDSEIEGPRVFNGHVTVNEGEDVTLSCTLSETKESISQVTWQRRTKGYPINENFLVITPPDIVHHVNGLGDRVRFIGNITAKNGSLQVLSVSLMDDGDYTCIFVLFPSGPYHTVLKLSVEVRPEVTISAETPPVAGEEEQMIAACIAAGARPPAHVTWVVEQLDSKVKVQTNETQHSNGTTTVRSYLFVVPTRSINQQEVLCVVKHTTWKQEKVVPFRIQVHYPPTSVNISFLERLSEGPVFQCVTDASPAEDTRYTWRRVDSLTSSISVKNDRNRSTFAVTRADLDGLYLCEASNKFGRASGSLFIHVADPHRGIYGVFIAIIGVLLVVLIAVVFYVLKSKRSQNGEVCSKVTHKV
ncbi:nectin-4-like [Arapaima gigas]